MSDFNNFTDSYYSDTNSAPNVPTSTAPQKSAKSLPRLWWGLVLGIVFAAGAFALAFTAGEGIVFPLIFSLFFLTFGASLALEIGDSTSKDVIIWMASRSIAFPGLIWEFDLDGFLWLIGMKLLFWLIGLIFGILCAILGVIVAIIISPISYPFNLYSYIKES